MNLNNGYWKAYLFASILLLTLTFHVYKYNSYFPQLNLSNYLQQTKDFESLDSLTNYSYIARRLEAAEENWSRANVRRLAALDQVHLLDGVDTSQASILWDFFYPSFDCPFLKERIGRVGDGGKWICGFEELISKSNCLIYSFGVSTDTSFEEEILRRTENCVVRMFDPTIGERNPEIVDVYPRRAFFYPIGISGFNSSQTLKENFQTLKEIMNQNDEHFVDVLKMDVEGSEWKSMRRILKDFPNKLPFAQLQIEVHLNTFQTEEWLDILSKWWKLLEESGLRAFFREPNLLNGQRYEYREIAFLNVKVEPFKI